MSRFRDDLRLIPRTAWLVAVLVYPTLLLVLFKIALPRDPKMRAWPLWGQVLFSAVVPLVLFVYVLLIGYVNGDARRRGMRYVLWTLLAIFVPNGIGIILYFVLRDPLLVPCPSCGVLARSGFVFCPQCGTALTRTCPHCGRSVEPGWSNCAYCGARLISA